MLSGAVDIVKVAFGRAPLEGRSIAEGTPWWDKELAHGWNYDPARAKALLTEAGFGNGFQTTLPPPPRPGGTRTPPRSSSSTAAIGIQELQLPDWSTRVSRGSRGQYDMAIHGVSSDNNDPDGLTVVLDTTPSPSHGRSFRSMRLAPLQHWLRPRRIRPGQARRDLQGDAARRP